MSDAKTLGEVYEDRNALAVAFAELALAYRRKLTENGDYGPQFRACWTPDQGDDADASEWAIIYVWLPTGQVSWHVPRDLAESSTLPRKHAAWDGHDRAKKNQRLCELNA